MTISWLDGWLARIIKTASTVLPQRTNLQFLGLTVEDDELNDTTKIKDDYSLKLAGGGNALMQRVVDVAYAQTTNATVTDIYTWPVRDEAVTLLRVEVLAVKSDGSKTASFVRYLRVKSDGAVVTVGAAANPLAEAEASFGVAITTDASGTTGRVRVTGIAATTIDWFAWVERFEGAHA